MINIRNKITANISSELNISGKISTSTKQVFPTLENLTVTPTKEQQTFNHENSYAYGNVTVEPIPERYIIPDGTLEVAANGDIDVTTFKMARVGVYTPPKLQDKSIVITENGIKNVTFDNSYDGLNSVEITTNIESSGSGDSYAPRHLSFYGYTGTELDTELATLDTSNMTTFKQLLYNCSKLKNINLSNLKTSHITSIQEMCYGCASLTSINFLNEIVWTNLTNCNSTFRGCTSLTSIDLSTFNIPKVTNIQDMFYGCTGLIGDVVISMPLATSLKLLGQMFYGCNKITSFKIQNTDLSKATHFNAMFYNCKALTTFDMSDMDVSNSQSWENIFWGCSALTTVLLPKTFSNKYAIQFNKSFYNCTSLKEIDMSSVVYAKALGDMFMGCTSLERIDMSNIELATSTGMTRAFYNCTSLKHLDIRKFDFSLVTEKVNIFYNVPADCEVIVKDDTQKQWILSNSRSDFTNIKTVAEL